MERPAPARPRRRALALLLLTLTLTVTLGGCAGEPEATGATPAREAAAGDGPLVLYCGRDRELMAPLLARFERETGIEVEARFGDSDALAARLTEEGTATPADAFLSSGAVALGGLSRKGLLRSLPVEVAREVPPSFAGAEPRLDWVGVTGRARALVYDPARTRPESLPRSLEALGDPAHRGRLALAPRGGALQAQMAAYRVLNGEGALDRLLARVHANEPRLYASDVDVVAAVAAGEAAWGLVDHVAVAAAGHGSAGALGVLFMPGEDGGSFLDPAGVAVLSDDPRALELVRFLLGEEAQAGLAERTGEYPLARGTAPHQGMPALAEIRVPRLDFADVAAVLDETGRALRRHGLGG